MGCLTVSSKRSCELRCGTSSVILPTDVFTSAREVLNTASRRDVYCSVGACREDGMSVCSSYDCRCLISSSFVTMVTPHAEVRTFIANQSLTGTERACGMLIGSHDNDRASIDNTVVDRPTIYSSLVCTIGGSPYVYLSEYNIWVVPEYAQDVDVFSNTNWNIS